MSTSNHLSCWACPAIRILTEIGALPPHAGFFPKQRVPLEGFLRFSRLLGKWSSPSRCPRISPPDFSSRGFLRICIITRIILQISPPAVSPNLSSRFLLPISPPDFSSRDGVPIHPPDLSSRFIIPISPPNFSSRFPIREIAVWGHSPGSW